MISKFNSLQLAAIISILFTTTSSLLLKCKEDQQPVYDRLAGTILYPIGDRIYNMPYCPDPGTDCAYTPSGFIIGASRGALNDFYEAERTNSLPAFYNSTDWNSLFPDMDERHAGILAGLKDGSYNARVGGEGSIFILRGQDTTINAANIVLAMKFID